MAALSEPGAGTVPDGCGTAGPGTPAHGHILLLPSQHMYGLHMFLELVQAAQSDQGKASNWCSAMRIVSYVSRKQ